MEPKGKGTPNITPNVRTRGVQVTLATLLVLGLAVFLASKRGPAWTIPLEARTHIHAHTHKPFLKAHEPDIRLETFDTFAPSKRTEKADSILYDLGPRPEPTIQTFTREFATGTQSNNYVATFKDGRQIHVVAYGWSEAGVVKQIFDSAGSPTDADRMPLLSRFTWKAQGHGMMILLSFPDEVAFKVQFFDPDLQRELTHVGGHMVRDGDRRLLLISYPEFAELLRDRRVHLMLSLADQPAWTSKNLLETGGEDHSPHASVRLLGVEENVKYQASSLKNRQLTLPQDSKGMMTASIQLGQPDLRNRVLIGNKQARTMLLGDVMVGVTEDKPIDDVRVRVEYPMVRCATFELPSKPGVPRLALGENLASCKTLTDMEFADAGSFARFLHVNLNFSVDPAYFSHLKWPQRIPAGTSVDEVLGKMRAPGRKLYFDTKARKIVATERSWFYRTWQGAKSFLP